MSKSFYLILQLNRPDYPADANMLLIDLLKKLFIKDPIKRISLQEII